MIPNVLIKSRFTLKVRTIMSDFTSNIKQGDMDSFQKQIIQCPAVCVFFANRII